MRPCQEAHSTVVKDGISIWKVARILSVLVTSLHYSWSGMIESSCTKYGPEPQLAKFAVAIILRWKSKDDNSLSLNWFNGFTKRDGRTLKCRSQGPLNVRELTLHQRRLHQTYTLKSMTSKQFKTCTIWMKKVSWETTSPLVSLDLLEIFQLLLHCLDQAPLWSLNVETPSETASHLTSN